MFGNNKNRTPSQKAQRAQLGIFVRLAACIYLIYILVKMLRTPSETTSPVFVTIIAIVMLALSALVIIITIREFLTGLKSGRYKASTYEEEDLNEYMNRKAEDGEISESSELEEGDGENDDDKENDDE